MADELLDKLCFVDVETTGLDERKDRIVSYCFLTLKVKKPAGLMRVFGQKDAHELYAHDSFIDPEGVPVGPEAYKVNKIKNESLIGKPKFREKIDVIKDFVGDRILVAHYASFDEKMLRAEFRRENKPFTFHFIDSIELLRAAAPNLPKYSLDFLCESLGIDKEGHNAVGDAIALYKLFLKCSLGNHIDIDSEINTAQTKKAAA